MKSLGQSGALMAFFVMSKAYLQDNWYTQGVRERVNTRYPSVAVANLPVKSSGDIIFRLSSSSSS